MDSDSPLRVNITGTVRAPQAVQRPVPQATTQAQDWARLAADREVEATLSRTKGKV